MPRPEGVPDPLLRLPEFLPYRLSVASNAVSSLVASCYEDTHGLKSPQWRLIAVLAESGHMTPQSICNRTVMDKVTVMRAAQVLLKRKLVERLPNAADGRSHHLRLTSAGWKLYAAVAPRVLAMEEQLIAGLGRGEVAQLKRILRHLESSALTIRPDTKSNAE